MAGGVELCPYEAGERERLRLTSWRGGTHPRMADVVHELLATTAAIEKLGKRGISDREVEQLPPNHHVIGRNPRGGGDRRLMVGMTDGGRVLTLVVEATREPTTWLVITGWEATDRERKMLRS